MSIAKIQIHSFECSKDVFKKKTKQVFFIYANYRFVLLNLGTKRFSEIDFFITTFVSIKNFTGLNGICVLQLFLKCVILKIQNQNLCRFRMFKGAKLWNGVIV